VSGRLAKLQRYVYWPKMQEVASFIRDCMLCCTSKPSNREQGLYSPLPVPISPWESILMEFVGGLSRTKRWHDYLYVVVDRFSEMSVLLACKKTIKG
jgi:hypothetical protein